MDAGCDDYIAKPMDLLDMLETVNGWMQRGA
jgi:DNA-binding response OmpR family regulator